MERRTKIETEDGKQELVITRDDEDRKNQIGTTDSPMSVSAFLKYAEQNRISIPDDFMIRLREALR